MVTTRQKIKRLTMAINLKYGLIYLISKKQVYSEMKGKVYNVTTLYEMMSYVRYKRLFPIKAKKRKDNGKRIRVQIMETFNEADILIALAKIYKGGEKDHAG